MTQDQAQFLASITDGEVRNNYSGRGMYGKETDGIVVESEEEFLRCIGGYLEEADDEDIEEINKIGEALSNYQVDDMGLQKIIY